jgi:type IV pilus assembly protein PilE
MPRLPEQPTQRATGFSLTELMIVVALAGVLLSLAVPGYRNFVLRAHRTAAIGKLLQAAACEERIYAARMAYDTTRCLPDAGKRYRLEFAEPGSDAARGYTLLATPTGPQARDGCGTLILDQLGRRSVTNASVDAGKCWSGR